MGPFLSSWETRSTASCSTTHTSLRASGPLPDPCRHAVLESGDHSAIEVGRPTLNQLFDDLQATVEQLDSNVSRHDAAIDIEQIGMELKRSRPDQSRVIGSVSRLSAVAGLEDKSANLLPLVERLFLVSDGS
jgi:hypothetical protein